MLIYLQAKKALSELRKDVLGTKILEVTFKEKTSYKPIKGIEIVSKTDYEVRLEIDLKTEKIDKVLAYLLKHYPIKDVNVSNPKIERIIKKLYVWLVMKIK